MSFLYVLYALYGSKKSFMSFLYVLYALYGSKKNLLCPSYMSYMVQKKFSCLNCEKKLNTNSNLIPAKVTN
jgi:hypothetical protein